MWTRRGHARHSKTSTIDNLTGWRIIMRKRSSKSNRSMLKRARSSRNNMRSILRNSRKSKKKRRG